MERHVAAQIHVNGEPRTITAGLTIADLLYQLDVRADRVAVEVNLQVVDRRDFDTRLLQDGDGVEIISFIGGGGDIVRRGKE